MVARVETKIDSFGGAVMINLMVCGHGRAGKDEFCESIGIPFISSSWACLDHVIWPQWGKFQPYISKEECFNDRSNHRQVWYNLITQYNSPDRTRLARKIYADAPIYCGIRNGLEFIAVRDAGLFDLSVWIDASDRLPPESTKSCTVTKDMCDIVIENNGSLEQFRNKIEAFKNAIQATSR